MTQHLFLIRDASPAEDEIAGHPLLPCALIRSPAVWGDPDPETGDPDLISGPELVPGAWAITVADAGLWDDPTVIAELEPSTGAATRWRDASIEGASISPILAGMAAAPIALVPPAGPVVTVSDVLAERSRRLGLGFLYEFGDERGVHQIGTTPEDMAGWDEVTQFAQAMMALGDNTSTITVVTDTGLCSVTAEEWMAVLVAAGAHRQPIWQASFVLQQMSPIPVDYAADSRWPPLG